MEEWEQERETGEPCLGIDGRACASVYKQTCAVARI